MTFVKIDSEETELSAIRQYAALRNYIRERNRSEQLNNLVDYHPAPRASSSEKKNGVNDDDKNVAETEKNEKKNNKLMK